MTMTRRSLLATLLSAIGQLTARSLQLPVEYYDEERYYKDVGSRWIGWGNGDTAAPAATGTLSTGSPAAGASGK